MTETDPNQIADWIRALIAPGQVTELRALNVPQKYGKPATMFGYFDSDHLDDMAVAATTLSEATGVYLTVNPVNADLLARAANRIRAAKEGETTGDKYIVSRRWLLVDGDPKRPAGISASNDEKEHARRVIVDIDSDLADAGWPAPIMADSGNGYHLLYHIDLPTDDDDIIKRCLLSLDSRYSTEHVSIDTAVFNPSRICKLYGTWSRKGDSTPTRPHRRSEILNVPVDLTPVPIDLLKRLAAEAPIEQPKVHYKANGHAQTNGQQLDVESFLRTRHVEILNRDTASDGSKRWFILCPGIASHSTANGAKDCVVTQEPDGRLGGKCFHDSCGMRSWRDIADALGSVTREDYPRDSTYHKPEAHAQSPNNKTTTPSQPMRSVRDLVGGFSHMREPLIFGLLREGETLNLIAASKVGKSWLATNLALTFCTRRKWLGRFETVGGDVLIVDNELHPETSAYRIPAVADANAIPLNEYADHVFVMNLRGELVTLPQLAITLDQIEPGRFKLIILDAFYRFLPPGTDENDNGAMATLYNLLDRVAAKLKCAIVCIHHASKGSQAGKAITDVGAGAGSMSRAADCHVILRPHEEPNVVVMEAATRSWPPLEPLCLRWEFPLFSEDPTLDPALLKPDRPRRPSRPETEKTLAEPVWTHQRFAKEFCAAIPQTRDAILAKAVDGGVAARKADELFKLAEGAGLLFEWPNVVRRKRGFATVPPPADTQKITHTHP